MKSERSLLNHLESCVEEDLAAQKRLVLLLADQEAAIVSNDAGALALATEALEGELRLAPTRSGGRERVLRKSDSESPVASQGSTSEGN